MAKISDKRFGAVPITSKIKRDAFETDFVAKSPPKRRPPVRPHPSAKIIVDSSLDEDLDGGFPIIKATEGPTIVTFGGIQLVAGILMIAFGILTMLHEASMSSVGAGLWGGAMGAANGFVGIIAGFRGCYQSTDRISPLAITVYLALCLVAIGVSNLALVLTATGLLRDAQRPDYFLPLKQEDYGLIQIEDTGRTNWAPVLANVGLLIITAVECLATIAAAFRCYWYVCRCGRRRPSLIDESSATKHDIPFRYDSPDVTTASYCSSSRSRQKLVRRWLGQQHQQQSTINPVPARSSVPFAPSYGPVPPYYTIDGKTIYPSSSFISYSDNNYMMPNIMESYYPQWPRVSLIPQPHRNSSQEKELGSRARVKPYEKPYPTSTNERCRKKSDSTVTEEDIDKTYTGLDREIAEEFISVAMEPKRM
ncbi:uncharacterized protein LOC135838554 [Planococcus citri]|uniref:uncharacterized protein LOC135838554 n=1 Tax=Planococcus citri TaxID=170843 RepID=UPI0031F7F697